MKASGFALFDSAIGRSAIVWSEQGIAGLQLPEPSVADTRARVRQRFGQLRETSPPRDVQRAIAAIGALLRGEARDLTDIPLDMADLPPFHRRVYEVSRTIAPGTTLSYGEVAARVGSPGSARAVGQALGRNPFAIIVPCHRVLAAGGKAGGFSANGGIATKLRLLSLEGVQLDARSTTTIDPVAAVEHLRRADAGLARVIERVGLFRLELTKTSSVFAALTEAIVHQQLSAKAAATIHGRLRAAFARKSADPTPEQLLRASDEKLRGVGLSRSKLAALRDLATRAKSGEVPSLDELQRMSDEAIVERLTTVRGIGRWTAEMLLIFRLGRPDILPLDDYGIRKGFAKAFRKPDLPSRDDLHRRGKRWKPYRTVASWYLWRALG